jgi:hypothetical protein
VQAVKKSPFAGVMGIAAHPFVPYILVLLALLKSL